MKKTGKTILSLVLSVLLITMTAVPFGSFAFASYEAELLGSGTCGAEGSNLTWTLTSDYVLTISGTGEMATYDLNEAPWSPEYVRNRLLTTAANDLGYSSSNEADAAFISGEMSSEAFLWAIQQSAAPHYSQYTDVTLVIEDGVTGISPNAFFDLHLADITIPASLTNIPDGSLPVYGKLTLTGDFGSFPNVRFECFTGDMYFTDADIYSDYIELLLNVGCLAEIAQEQPLNDESIENYVAYYLSIHEGATRDDALSDLEEMCNPFAVFIAAESGVYGEGRNDIIAKAWQSINAILGTDYPDDADPALVYQDEFQGLIGERFFGDPGVIYPSTAFLSLDDFAANDNAILAPAITVTVPCDSAVREQLAAAGAASVTELSHSWGEWTQTVPATCTAHGVMTRVCAACSAEETDVIAATGHQNAVTVPASEATETAHGHTEGVYCPDCNTWLSGHEVIHNTLGERTYLDEYTEDGEQMVVIKCTVCGGEGLYAVEPVAPTEPEIPDDGTDGKPMSLFAKAIQGFINIFLRLIQWIKNLSK